MFYQPAHQHIFEAMVSLTAEGCPIDNVTLVDKLRRASTLEKVGGAAYLAELVADVASAANVRHHVGLVKEAALVRRIRELCISSARRCEDSTVTPGELLEEMSRTICALAQGSKGGGFVELPEVYKETLNAIDDQAKDPTALAGISTGFTDLDNLTGGLYRGETIILAARPSMGKTSLALAIARAAMHNGHAVGVFSLEMPKKQLGMRLLSASARVDVRHLRGGRLSPEEWDRLARAAQATAVGMIHMNDNAVRTLAQVQAQARLLKTTKGLDLLIIDYLQLLEGPDGKRRDGRHQEVSDISRSLKLLAMDLDIPILVLSQLSRAVEARKPPIPMLADLRESGAIEQDADVVMFIYREDVYDQNSERKGLADIIVGKQRNGPLGRVTLSFVDQFAAFEDMETAQ
jgi:replicative DNA helicase